jgi:hypothetical protein
LKAHQDSAKAHQDSALKAHQDSVLKAHQNSAQHEKKFVRSRKFYQKEKTSKKVNRLKKRK